MKFNLPAKLTKITMIFASLGFTANAFADGYHTQNGGTTGGAGGNVVYATTGTQIHEALCSRASSDTPLIIEVEGTINHGNTTKVSGDSCNTAADKIELKEISNVTLIGVGNGALFDELGIHIRSASNIIIRNVHVRNVKKSGSPTSNGGDAIGMESNVSNVWVDHVTLEASGGESEGYDALFDLKGTSKYVTLSYSILRNSGRGGLVGSSDSDDNNGPVTYHHNYYQNINSRTPLLRHATAHSYNNYFNGIQSSGMNPRIGGQIKAEHNYFENANNPLGTFYTDDMGYWEVNGNIWGANVVWTEEDSGNHPAGPNPSSTTSISIPYSYQLDDASCVPALILATAGADTQMAESDGSCSVTGGGDNGNGDNGGDGDNGGGDNGGGGDSGTNLAIGAGADGSSKASGTSYGNVIDGNVDTFWSPSGSTGTINVKNLGSEVSAARIVESAGAEGRITAWSLVNYDTGVVLASGNSVPDVVTFNAVTLNKLSFVISAATGTPQIAEFEVYASSTGSGNSNGNSSSQHNSIVSGTYRIAPVHSGQTLDVTNCASVNGVNVRQWSWLNNECQQFIITPVDDIWHRVSPVNAPNLALEVDSSSTTSGANVMLWEYWGGYNQQFRFQSAGNGKWRLVNRNSELCLDIEGASATEGANLIQWTCTAGRENQMFELISQ
ncbi:pectate trisaccharide-lyase [Alteromonas pelagimontana]|uniref:Pectate trisaccharide-lyase n=1 Tax=Alteromonas pelagimontana TaxID=1858656 RepID=A0A6M4MI47_9ALTE|nr:RICIN domain-containing protein [Alteromonas pelagimontana]QJR82270.1 pectate trisaccharide-lyase [Alteromonas pelagimontana]